MLRKNKHNYQDSGIDTSIEGFRYVGINLTEEQYDDLCYLNIVLMNEKRKNIPVFNTMLILKTLGLLPPEMVNEESSGHSNDNSNKDFKEDFYRKYGRPKH